MNKKMKKMNKQELRDYFLAQLKNGQAILKVAKGNAHYKMSRGSFKTRDHIYDVHQLKYKTTIDHRVIFGDERVEAEIIVDDSHPDYLKFHFHVDYGYNRFYLQFNGFNDEHFYGCGEQYTTLDLKNKKVPIWVSEHQQVLKIVKKLLRWKLKGHPEPDRVTPYKNHQTYCSFPIFISSSNYGVYCHADAYGCMKFSNGTFSMRFREIPQSISLLTANNQKELIENMTKLVGVSPEMPDWVNDGAILAMQGGTDVLKEKYKEAKEKGIKISALWAQDWCGHVVTSFGYQVYWNWKVDDELYHGLQDFIKELHKDGVKFLGYINTFLKEGAPLYNEAKHRNLLVRKKDGSVYHIKSTTFDAGIVDLTNPTAYQWYKDVIKNNMVGFGLDGWMADFGEYLPTDAVVYGGDAAKMHNRWPTLWAKCCYEAVHEMKKEKEVFYFNRAAYGHTVQYTNSMWNGDQHVDYSDEYGLGSVIPASLSLSCSGCGVVHSDIGGYTTVMFMKRDAELMRRWSEMNIFTPVYRTHEGNRPKDNAQFNHPEVIEEFAENSHIYAELKPYRKAIYDELYKNGTPLIRPLFMHYSDERSKVEQKEYLFGEDILVSPVLRPGEKEHKVYLPEGKWVQFFTGEEYDNGEYVIASPLGVAIAFYKKTSQFTDLFTEITKKHYKGGK